MSEKFDTVLEIGCLDGKWSEVLIREFKEVVLVDLDRELVPVLRKKFGEKFIFHTTKGDELNSLNDDSINLIFSMDSLVRLPKKKFILNYFMEFKRVLKKDGEVYVHLPCNSKIKSVEKGFTDISKDEIKNYAELSFLKLLNFDEITLDHGILIHLKKY